MRLRSLIVTVAGAAAAGALALPGSAAAAFPPGPWYASWEPLCQSHDSLCADSSAPLDGEYVGHDEPSVLFKSNIPGSGNDVTWYYQLSANPSQQPNNSGAGGTTWGFQLRATDWFGMAVCDSQSAPEYTQQCAPDSDSNDLVSTNPHSHNYIGKHPGQAYMELQFYPPGYVEQFTGFGCTATQYCAAMTIDSRTLDQANGVENNADCNNYVLGGPEPVNWAYVTTSGQSQAPANPLFTGTLSNPNFAAVNPDPTKDLMMNPGDIIKIHMYDTPAGLRIDLDDLTTGQTGSMTASIANGFGHIMYEPSSSTCHEEPYAFHPEYSTANPRGNTWTVATYNIAHADELGHFENCQVVDQNFNCAVPGAQDASGLDQDDAGNFCVPGSFSTLVMIGGCYTADEDWDSQSYNLDWPGTNPDPVADAALHPTSELFTSPLANGRQQYSTVEFNTDLPRIEASDSQFNPPFCDVASGANCVDPPSGANFYPIYSTGMKNGLCYWQEGGDYIPGTTNDFGGSSTTEYGGLQPVVYERAGVLSTDLENFNSADQGNPCPAVSLP